MVPKQYLLADQYIMAMMTSNSRVCVGNFFRERDFFLGEELWNPMALEKRFPVRLPNKLYMALVHVADRQNTNLNRLLGELIDKILTARPVTLPRAGNPFRSRKERVQLSVRLPEQLHEEFRAYCRGMKSTMTSMIIRWLLQMPEIRDRLWSHHRIRVDV